MGIFNFRNQQEETGNVLRTTPKEPDNPEKRRAREPRNHRGNGKKILALPFTIARNLLDGTLLTHDRVIRNIPFILFVTLLTIIYITNSTLADRNRRELIRISEELKELRYQYISTKSGVMYESNPSQISKKLKETGIRENTTPPVKIFTNPNPEKPR